MYHCATQPVLMHTGMGMVGMFVVKPKHLAPVDKELWITQQEYYLGQPGKGGDMAKMDAKKPDVIAFNGYANQYQDHPITVKKGERVRMYVLNAGPSIWSAFHVIGTVFDRTVIEGRPGADSQTMNLAPSQGGWAEFTLDGGGRLSLRHPRVRRRGQGRDRRPPDRARPEGGRGPRHEHALGLDGLELLLLDLDEHEEAVACSSAPRSPGPRAGRARRGSGRSEGGSCSSAPSS